MVSRDPWLEPYTLGLIRRHENLKQALARVSGTDGSLEAITTGHRYFGFNRGERDGQPGLWYREWAPGARALFLIGDFNFWDRGAHPLARDEYGVWHLFLPADPWAGRLTHGSRVKVHIIGADGSARDRVPAYVRRVVQEPQTHDFVGQFWAPPESYRWVNPTPVLANENLRIYETHVGMAQEAERVGTFAEFTSGILPRIRDAGYTVVQLMAVMEHPYYGSYGYHVSNFFAVSSRFGTPEELKELIDTAHGMGLLVLLDLVHSHFVKNVNDGLNGFDGTDHQYTHGGARGVHKTWDSMLFDYRKHEVLRFLLSNVRFWLEEFHFDGFRFDGVTSMLYRDHGVARRFTCYDDYFNLANLDEDALTYLQLANTVAHLVKPGAVTIAEDVSGMVGTARPVAEDGLGFDFRLAMGLPDFWVRLLKEKRDEEWGMDELYHTLINRRFDEKHVGYAESHDQALVGDKTLAFWLMDAHMYTGMDNTSHNPVVDRGVALHKLIRLTTFALGGDAYLNFMGNEFGHPEWIDFPREGNQYSHRHACRHWSLLDNGFLRYHKLGRFDRAMQELDRGFNLLGDPLCAKLKVHEDDKLLVFRRGPLVFLCNFHPTRSLHDYAVPVPDATDYLVILNTDDACFGGFGLVTPRQTYIWHPEPLDSCAQRVRVYLPARSAQVLAPVGMAAHMPVLRDEG